MQLHDSRYRCLYVPVEVPSMDLEILNCKIQMLNSKNQKAITVLQIFSLMFFHRTSQIAHPKSISYILHNFFTK